jgi:hypothetical protein
MEKKNQPVQFAGRIARNDPCFCGSDKKFKRCHGMKGDFRMQAEEKQEAVMPTFSIRLKPDGSADIKIDGNYPIPLLIGHMEVAKQALIQNMQMQQAMQQAQKQAKGIVLPNGPMPNPRFPE